MTPTKEELARLRAVAEAATPGPWQNGIDDREGVVAPKNAGPGNVICIPPLKHSTSPQARSGALAMTFETRAFDAANYLDTPEAVVAYLEDALSDANPEEFVQALGVVARARGMTSIARELGVARPALYRALSEGGKPAFSTVMRVLHTLGLNVHVTAAANGNAPDPVHELA